MVDTDSRTDSLVNLLIDIEHHAADLPCPFARSADPALVHQDIKALRAAADKIEIYVDKHVAHVDKTSAPAVPSFVEIDAALDLLGEMLKKYTLLLRPRCRVGLQYQWTAVFREVWIRT